MQKFSFLRGWEVFFSKKRHFFSCKTSIFAGLGCLFEQKKWHFLRFFRKCRRRPSVGEPGGPKRAKRARANSRRESRVGEDEGHYPLWVRASFTLRYWASVGEPSRPKRAKRARANSRRESRVGKAGGHQPVWVPVSLTLRCRPPTPLVVKVKWSEWSEVKWSESNFLVLYFF